MVISAKDILNARNEMGDAILRTPMIYSPGLSQMTGADIHLKLENQQMTSSFKPRGAFTRMAALDKEDALRGVIAMSAGNHAQAVAYHAHCYRYACPNAIFESKSNSHFGSGGYP